MAYFLTAWCDDNDVPYNAETNDVVANAKIVSQKKLNHLPLAPQVAAKLFRLSTGQESHPTHLIPEGGVCEHGHAFEQDNPIRITDAAKIIVGSVLLGDIHVFKLKTGKDAKIAVVRAALSSS